jgi:hypothetical protein
VSRAYVAALVLGWAGLVIFASTGFASGEAALAPCIGGALLTLASLGVALALRLKSARPRRSAGYERAEAASDTKKPALK